jgi:hypothetical protein
LASNNIELSSRLEPETTLKEQGNCGLAPTHAARLQRAPRKFKSVITVLTFNAAVNCSISCGFLTKID